MKTRFSILSALLCIFVASSWAEATHETTTDKVTFSELTLNPGEYGKVTVSLENSVAYTAFGLDIELPVGYEFYNYYNEDEEEYVMVEKGTTLKSSHAIGYNIQSNGCLRVTAHSESSQTFKSASHDLFSFYVKATSYAKPGKAVFKVKNCFFTSAAGVQYDTTDEETTDEVTTGTTGTLDISVSADNKWSTLVSPFKTTIPDGVKVYKYVSLDKTNEVVNVKQQPSIEAYTPYVLYAESGYTGTLTGTIDATNYKATVTDGLLVGVIEKQSVSDGYVLQNLKEGVKFYTMASAFTIPAGKCYLLPSDASSKLSIAFEDETDGINDINANANDDVYDLQGRKLQNPQQRGIYIVNGKKVVKK